MNIEQARGVFNAQYFGQKVYHTTVWYDNETSELGITQLEFLIKQSENIGYLLLRTVNQLTDDECKFCYQLRDIEMSEGGSKDDFSYIKHQIILWCKYGNLNYLNYQYLLRIGIILPFTYISDSGNPITLSVEELLKLNWCRIKD